METIHCNGCHHIPQLPGVPQRRYFISSCGHVFCFNCVPQNEVQCSVCKAEKSRFLEINQNARPDIKAYFMDPMAVLRENMKQTTQVLNFQKSQAKSYQGLVAKLYEAYKTTMQERNSLKQQNERLTRNYEDLQRKMEELISQTENRSWMGNNGMNFIQPAPVATPNVSRRQMIFSDMRTAATPSDAGTPFNITTNGHQTPLFTPSPQGPAGRSAPTPGSGVRNSSFVMNGRLTIPRTPEETISTMRRVGESQVAYSQTITPGRGGSQMRSAQNSEVNPTQDIVSRLRQLQRPSLCESPPFK